MSILVRWYVGRLLKRTKDPSEPKTYASVIITPAKSQKAGSVSLEDLANAKADNLDWWSDDESDEIDGIIESSELEKHVLKHSIKLKAKKDSELPSKPERKIVEGMVFVQMLPDSKTYSAFKKSHVDPNKLTNLSELAQTKGSQWLDFTVQARKLTGEVYTRLMGGGEETGHATK